MLKSFTTLRLRSVLLLFGGIIVLAYLPLIKLVNRATNSMEVFQIEPHIHHNHRSHSKDRHDHYRHEEPAVDPEDGFPLGILSHKSQDSYFQPIRDQIDAHDLDDRCRRFQFTASAPNTSKPAKIPRRIFYGSLIANEPWELFDIMATETHGIFAGVVFVESNRTQNFSPRPFRRANPRHLQRLKTMFGLEQVQIRQFVNEDPNVIDLAREHFQRQEILKGWKELGMTPDDVGYIADADETFSRDFLRAVQYCPYVDALDYDWHHCYNVKTKIVADTRVFETSPECITRDRSGFHPDMVLGRCIEEIGNPNDNIVAPRQEQYLRQAGYGRDCNPQKWNASYGKIPGNKHPLWSAGDFRAQCGGRMYHHVKTHNHTKYTAFHIHNFFADFQVTRHKYLTYGHPYPTAMTDPLEVIHEDLMLMVRCVLDQTDATTESDVPEHVERQTFARVRGGMNASLPPWPIYFHDADYRHRKHASIRRAVLRDEALRLERLNLSAPQLEYEQLTQVVKEGKRVIYDQEKRLKQLKQDHNLGN